MSKWSTCLCIEFKIYNLLKSLGPSLEVLLLSKKLKKNCTAVRQLCFKQSPEHYLWKQNYDIRYLLMHLSLITQRIKKNINGYINQTYLFLAQ